MKKSRLFLIISVVACLCLLLFSCNKETGCTHKYDNECDNECNLCGEQRAVLSHLWHSVDQELCQYKQTCAWCGLTMGENVEHNYTDENGNALAECLSCGHPNPSVNEPNDGGSNSGGSNGGNTTLPDAPTVKTNKVTYEFNYTYGDTFISIDNEPRADLLVDNCYLSYGFGKITIPDDIVAGDTITIEYTGEIVDAESYPGQKGLYDGEVISYSFDYAEVIHLEGDKFSIENVKESYIYNRAYVILDRSGKYVKLDEYTGNEIYLVVDPDMLYGNDCSGESSGNAKTLIACMLAYNPRKTNN